MPSIGKFIANNLNPIMSGVNTIGNILAGNIGLKRQYKYNKKAAQFQHNKNMELLKYQLDYNSPASQMQRFKDAGLNPNLMYGQGDSGSMSQAPRYPDVNAPDVQSAMAPMYNLGTQFQQMRLMEAQADLANQKVSESGTKQDLMKAQKNLVNANPHLNKAYVDAMVLNLESVAKMKQAETSWMTTLESYQTSPGEVTIMPRGLQKVRTEIDLLTQKFNLGTADQKIKGEILTSKDFQNQLQKIQLDWMKDGEITPQHIYMGIMLLLSKMM